MAYAALADMVTRFGVQEMTQLTNGTNGTPVEAPADAALADATALINSFVAGRYVVPLDPVPDPVPKWCCDLARYHLWRDEPSAQCTQLYQSAMSALKAVAAGSMTLDTAGVDATVTSDVIEIHAQPQPLTGAPRFFTPFNLQNF